MAGAMGLEMVDNRGGRGCSELVKLFEIRENISVGEKVNWQWAVIPSSKSHLFLNFLLKMRRCTIGEYASDDGRIIRRTREWERDVVRSERAIIKTKEQTIILYHCQHTEKEGVERGRNWLRISVLALLPTYCHQVVQ
jgi:hypothetical protein